MILTKRVLKLRHFKSSRMSEISSVASQMDQLFFDSAAVGHVDEIDRMLKGTMDINAKNDRGWTALMFAARSGQSTVIRFLLDKGCDAKLLNASGQSALDIARFWNHAEAVQALTQAAGDTEAEEPVRNYYSLNPLYRASEQRKLPDWVEQAQKKDSSKFIVFSDLKPFLIPAKARKGSFELALFGFRHLESFLLPKQLVIFLGLETWDPHSAAWFAIDFPSGDSSRFAAVYPDGFFAEPYPVTMKLIDVHAGIFAEARSMLCWHDRYSFCPTCGSSTTVAEAGYKRVCDAENCRSQKGIHNTSYPRLDPSLIMLVISPDRQKCLLGRKKIFPGKMYSCLAGFMEPGESIEDTCRREVEEESGVKVGRVEYHSSQPWPFPAVLMLGCIAYAKTDKVKVDDDELEDARWFTQTEVAQMLAKQHPDGLFVPPAQAIAHTLIKSWITKTANL